jgi:transcriptional regulator with XRE-family HTH domain
MRMFNLKGSVHFMGQFEEGGNGWAKRKTRTARDADPIGIGEKIRQCRKQRGITQEQLADYLNISFQSVSKWECGEAYPDIVMLPKIAVFFGVTADELLCMDKAKEAEDIRTYIHRWAAASEKGNTEEAITVMREAAAKYPGNYEVMEYLISAIKTHAISRAGKDNQPELFKEILAIGGKIRAECRDDRIRYDILPDMCLAYRLTGESDKAVKLAKEELRGVYASKEVALDKLLTGDDLTRHRQENLILFSSSNASNA